MEKLQQKKTLKSNRQQLLQRLLKESDDLDNNDIEELTYSFKQKKINKQQLPSNFNSDNSKITQDDKIIQSSLTKQEQSKSNQKNQSLGVGNNQLLTQPSKSDDIIIQKKLTDMKIEDDQNQELKNPEFELQIKDVDGDGNCLWYSICTTLTGKVDYYKQLKTYLLFLTFIQYDSIKDYIPELNAKEYYEEYIKDRVWGNLDHLGEIIATGLGRQIILYTKEDLINHPPYIIYGQDYKFKDSIYIYYNGVNHYKAILKKDINSQKIIDIDERPLNKLMQDILDQFFSFKVYSNIDQQFIDLIIDEVDFYEKLNGNTYSFNQFIEFLEETFQIYLHYNKKPQIQQLSSSKKRISMLQLPSKIFEKSKITFDFNCCQYKQQYPLFNETLKQDSYNEKYKYLQSITKDKKKSEYYYPDRIRQISDYKKRSNKMNKFRNSALQYGLEKCGQCGNDRLVFYENDQDLDKRKMFIVYLDQIDDILSLIHNTTHRKRDHMVEILNRLQIIIPQSRDKITQFIQNCKSCSQDPIQRKRAATKQIISTKPLERLQMDCMELHHKLQQNGYVQLLNIKDHFSRFSKSYVIKNKKQETIADCLQDFFLNQGVPEILQTDNGLEFNNTAIKTLCDEYSVEYIRGRPYHPQSQGSIERFNRWIHRRLKSDKFDLKKSVYQLIYDYNNTVSRITKSKPIEAIKLSTKNQDDIKKIENIIESVQQTFPKCKNPLDFNIDDKALLSNEVTNKANQNVIIKKPTLKKKSGQLKLFNIPVTVTKVNNLNVSIRIDGENNNNLYVDQDYLCPVVFLKLIQKECWQKFIKLDNLQDDNDEIEIDMIDENNNFNDDSEISTEEQAESEDEKRQYVMNEEFEMDQQDLEKQELEKQEINFDEYDYGSEDYNSE